MSLFDDALSAAADTTNVQAGGTSFTQGVSDAITLGAPAAVVSGLGSIYNTAAAGINALGGSVEELSTYKQLQELDENWANYYKAHETAIDTVGFVATSFIPGTAAIKGLNAIRSGESVGAMGRALGFFRTKQVQALDSALAEMAAEGGTVFTRINKNKAAAMAWGFADQTLTAAAFETGVALTMKQSPLLADDSWWDIGKSALTGAAFGGVIGGSIDSLILNKSFKTAVKTLDSKQRNYDAITDLTGLNLVPGDKAYAIADSLVNLPKEVLASDKILDLSFHLAQGPVKRQVDISKILGNTLQSSEKSALLDFETTLQQLSTDSTVSQAGAEFILRKFQSAREQNLSDSAIKDLIGDNLFELRALRAATEIPTTTSSDLWYFNKALSPADLAGIKNIKDWEAAIKSNVPFSENAYKSPYVFRGTPEQRVSTFENAALIGRDGDRGFPTLAAAWKAGHDVAFMPDGAIRVNDGSKLWSRVDDPVYKSSRFLNTRTGAMTEDTVLTAADMLPAGKALDSSAIRADAVVLAQADGKPVVLSMKQFLAPDGDTRYFTARHAWASKLADDAIPDVVDVTDFSLMDRLRTASPETLERVQIHSGEHSLGSAADSGFTDTLRSAKLSEAERLFSDAYATGSSLDVRAVAYQLNVDAQWLENAVANRFHASLAGDLEQTAASARVKATDGQLSLDLSSYTRRENLVADFVRPQQFRELDILTPEMTWQEKRNLIMESTANSGGQFVTGELAWGQRVRDAIQVNQNAAAAVLGTQRVALLPAIGQNAAQTADSSGAGAGTFGAANANYGDGLALQVQDTGKHVHQWIQDDVNAVVDTMGTVSTKLRNNPIAASELGVVTNLLRSTDEKYVWSAVNPKQLILRELGVLEQVDPAKYQDALKSATGNGRRAIIELTEDDAVNFLKTHTTLNAERLNKRTVLNNAKGFVSNMDPTTVYVPPIDTTYFQHFAFVRPIEGKAFGTSEVSMVFGRNADELSKRISSIDRQNFDVVTKKETEKFFKAKDLYDYDLTINEPRINSELRKTGALNNFQPEMRSENLVEDFMRWHQNQAARLVRDSVETHYAQQFAELRKLGESYSNVASSQFAGSIRRTSSEIKNPYDDYIKTALDVSKRSEYQFLHQANEFVDALGTRAYQAVRSAFGDAEKGIVTWAQANTQMEKFGIKGVYSNKEEFFTANLPRDRNLVREYVSKANAFLANTVLRLDFFNSVVNTISTPMMLGTELASIKNLIKTDPALVGKLSELTNVLSPDGVAVPSTTKLIAGAIKNFFGADKEVLLARYKANGDVRDSLSQFHSMLDNLSLRADFKNFSDGVNKAFETGARLTLSEQAEQMTRFISADVMRQLTDPLLAAGKLSLKEQNAYISVFTNRVQGNYISSQRPIVFQGVLGSAVSLFQTYSFNLMQQLLRHVENRDKRAVATLFGMQAGTFGLNGTPFFEAVNTHLIGNSAINQGHYDAYSIAPQLMGKGLGDWLMYGTASAMPAFFGANNWPALYTRGDINPRHASIIPINPLDVPAIDAGTRIIGNLLDVGSKLVSGANVGETLLQGLEHNGINRPLAGLAQVLNGKATTSKGGLVSASNDFSMIATGARILGAKPMDEAVALNNLYRMKSYQTADQERLAQLGERVKSYLYKNQFPPDEVMDKFMSDYARVGGRVENFNASMQSWAKQANTSVVESMRGKMQSSYGQRLNEIMGGTPLEDYSGVAAQVPATGGEE